MTRDESLKKFLAESFMGWTWHEGSEQLMYPSHWENEHGVAYYPNTWEPAKSWGDVGMVWDKACKSGGWCCLKTDSDYDYVHGAELWRSELGGGTHQKPDFKVESTESSQRAMAEVVALAYGWKWEGEDDPSVMVMEPKEG